MGTLVGRLRQAAVVGKPEEGVQYECRRCGKTMKSAQRICPDCGGADVARYEL
jgi:ribosomal protein L37E